MRFFCIVSAAFFLSAATFSCGGKNDNESAMAPQGMHTLDLSHYGKPFAIFVPDTLISKLQIIEQSTGALDIKVGKSFAISISEQFADIELRKTDIKDDEVNKLKNFIIHEPDVIMWESAWQGSTEETQFHFLINKKIGSGEYSFEDIKDPDVGSFGKEPIQKMFDCCKSINEIKRDTGS